MSASSVSPDAKRFAADLLRGSALAVRAEEVDRLYYEDFGLGEYEETGLGVLEVVNTDLLSIKILVLLPRQTCPEHRHRPAGEYPGKEETFRCQWGECYLYVPGPPTPGPRATPPTHRRDSYTVWHEIRLGPGDQHTAASDTRHWFQAGPEGAVVWSLCSRAVVGADEFTDRDILGPTRLGLGRRRCAAGRGIGRSHLRGRSRAAPPQGGDVVRRRTEVSIRGDSFSLNGRPTYEGRRWRGHNIEGLLLNSRMVQAIFDDLNPETRGRWAYPDTGVWDPGRNTQEFVEAMLLWREHGLLAVTVNLQGGNPGRPYSSDPQPWHNSAWTEDGQLRPAYADRLRRVLDRADELDMVVILGLFYFGQDGRLRDEVAVRGACGRAASWLLGEGYTNVLVEINNECDTGYSHEILKPGRVHELIEQVKTVSHEGRRLLVGTSYGGGALPGASVLAASDFVLLHGNFVEDPERIAELVRETRALPSYRPMPILFNEDDHCRFDEPMNNMVAAVSEHASWGYLDKGVSDYQDGYQRPPVNWGINTERKKAFFGLVGEITGR